MSDVSVWGKVNDLYFGQLVGMVDSVSSNMKLFVTLVYLASWHRLSSYLALWPRIWRQPGLRLVRRTPRSIQGANYRYGERYDVSVMIRFGIRVRSRRVRRI